MILDKQVLIYGCKHLGGAWNEEAVTTSEKVKAFDALEAAYESGYRYFDHADIYCMGKSESVFGEFLKENPGIRDNMIIQSKVGIEWGKAFGGSHRYNFSKEYLWQQLYKSLKYLQTDYLDVLMLHRPDPICDVEEIAETFSLMYTQGLVKNFGVSNMNVPQNSFLQSHCKEPLIANQIQISIGHSDILNEGTDLNSSKYRATGMSGILEFLKAHYMAIQICGPLDGGRFAVKEKFKKPEDKQVKKLLDELSVKYEVSPDTIQTAWLFNIPGIIQPVIGTTNPIRIQACSQALNLSLTREDWYDLWIAGRGKLC